jgi:hypothetical protein
MIRIFTLLFFLVSFSLSAQSANTKTESFTINGKVKAPQTITFSDLKKFKIFNLGDVTITNHLGEVKGTAKNLSGVLLREILQSVPLDTENPKQYSEYFFICRASDGYKVVYSWNEIFNTATGNSAYIITEKNHQPIRELDESMLMISTQDEHTGTRYVKNLESIYVGRAD